MNKKNIKTTNLTHSKTMELSTPQDLIGNDFLVSWEVIGSGGFGQIHRAKHVRWGIDVAVKVLHHSDGLVYENIPQTCVDMFHLLLHFPLSIHNLISLGTKRQKFTNIKTYCECIYK